ncbi:MAG: cytochrome c maturation protein CcmE [Ilumatobacteraceae bacterium]
MDLTPRTRDTGVDPDGSGAEFVPPAPRVHNRRKWVSIGLLITVLAIGGVVVTKFLTSSLDYYCNVDEVGAKNGCETGRRLRIQGTVDEGSVNAVDGVTTFDISFNGVTKEVVYDGDPGGAFQECIPVVVHGVMQDNGVFDGDEVEVKHGNDYEAKHADRLNEAEAKSQACQAASSGSNQ